MKHNVEKIISLIEDCIAEGQVIESEARFIIDIIENNSLIIKNHD